MAKQSILFWANSHLKGIGQIFLYPSRVSALFILIAILIASPAMALSALVGAGVSQAVAITLYYPKKEIYSGLYGYNGALIALLLSALFPFKWQILMSIASSAGIVCILTHALRTSLSVPSFTAAFNLIGWAALGSNYLLDIEPPMPAVSGINIVTDLTSQTLFNGISQVVFIEHATAGVLIWAGLLLSRPRLALWAMVASGLSWQLSSWLHFPQDAILSGLYGYNAILVAIALTQWGKSHWLCTLFAILLSTLLTRAFHLVEFPPLTAPFILTFWLLYTMLPHLQKHTVLALQK